MEHRLDSYLDKLDRQHEEAQVTKTTQQLAQEDREWALDFQDDPEAVENALLYDGVVEAADGCTVEPDGVCPHGHESPLLVLGLI